MPSQSRKHRGYATQRIVADYLAAHGWPFADSTGAGRAGTDVTGTPGLHWEVKARARLDLGADLRQAVGHGSGAGILVVRLNGTGPTTIADWPAVMRLADLVDLLRLAGFGDPLPVEIPDVPAFEINPYEED